MTASRGAATAAQHTSPKGAIVAEKLTTRTTIGKTIEDASPEELRDLKRLGLIATKKDQRAASAAIDDADAQRAAAAEGATT